METLKFIMMRKFISMQYGNFEIYYDEKFYFYVVWKLKIYYFVKFYFYVVWKLEIYYDEKFYFYVVWKLEIYYGNFILINFIMTMQYGNLMTRNLI